MVYLLYFPGYLRTIVKSIHMLRKIDVILEESYVTFMFVGHVNFYHIENYIKIRHL